MNISCNGFDVRQPTFYILPKQWGKIHSHPENSVPQTIVLPYQEIGGIYCVRSNEAMVVYLTNI
jgi:hypothetical protein